MTWYAAHAIIYFEFTDGGPQDGYQIYENVYLVQAETADEGFAKAREFAKRDTGDSSGSLRVGGRSATNVFGGIRKLITVSHVGTEGQLGDGDEITYSELTVPDRTALDRLITNEDVEVNYIGHWQLPPMPEQES